MIDDGARTFVQAQTRDFALEGPWLAESWAMFGAVNWSSLGALLLASLVVMGSPGPATISATAMGAAFGLRRALPYVAGLIVGTCVVLLAVAFGVGAAIAAIPHGAQALAWASAAYILYLAFKIAGAPPLDQIDEGTAPPVFASGLALAIANPKAYLAIAAVYAEATLAPMDRNIDAALKVAALGGMIVVIHLAWATAGAGLSRTLQRPFVSRLVNLALAAMLVAVTLASFAK
jgi:threonine/homoserine/homoserine lactone efflux protein